MLRPFLHLPYLWELRPYLRQTAGLLVIGSLMAIIMNTAIVLPALMLGRAIDAVLAIERGEGDATTAGWAALSLVIAAGIVEGSRIFKRYWLITANQRIRANLRADALRGVLSWPAERLHQTPVGDLMARIDGDVETLGLGVREATTEIWDTVLFSISLIVAMLMFDGGLTLLALLPVPAAMALALFTGRWVRERISAARAAAAHATAALQELLAGVRVLRLFGHEATAIGRYGALSEEQAETMLATQRLRSTLAPTYTVMMVAGVIVILWQGGEQVITGLMTAGQLVAFLELYLLFVKRGFRVPQLINSVQAGGVAYRRLRPLLAPALSVQGEPPRASFRPGYVAGLDRRPEVGDATETDRPAEPCATTHTARPRPTSLGGPLTTPSLRSEPAPSAGSGQALSLSKGQAPTLVGPPGVKARLPLTPATSQAEREPVAVGVRRAGTGRAERELTHDGRDDLVGPTRHADGHVGGRAATASDGTPTNRPDPAAAPWGRGAGRVDLRDVTFCYPGATLPALVDLSLTLPPGALVGVTGAVGSGKSALAKALVGLYQLEQGRILVDDVPLDTLRADESAALIGYLPQDSWLFSGTIRENVVFGAGALAGPSSDDLVARAIRLAALEQDIASFPAGLETPIGEGGVRVSGGQRQRIALARALLAGAPGRPGLLVLDDPFSAVDVDTEIRLIEGLLEAVGPAAPPAERATIVLCSHRLAAFPRMDLVVLLDEGRVAERGTHAELLAADGRYAHIYLAQQRIGQAGCLPIGGRR
jgi:ABC-type multidrug transport system fused ATPase/permease subunit